METIKESITLEKEILELVLKEMLEEQQKANEAIVNQSIMIEALTNKINSVLDTMENSKTISPTVNTKQIEESIKNAVMELEVKAPSTAKNYYPEISDITFSTTGCQVVLQDSFWTLASFVGYYVIDN